MDCFNSFSNKSYSINLLIVSSFSDFASSEPLFLICNPIAWVCSKTIKNYDIKTVPLFSFWVKLINIFASDTLISYEFLSSLS